MSKGAYERKYKQPKDTYPTKADRLKKEERQRELQAQAFSPKEKFVYEFLQNFSIAHLEATAKGYIVDDTEFTKTLVKKLEEFDD